MAKALSPNVKAARDFATAYLAGEKSSVAMVKACIPLVSSSLKTPAIVAALRAEVASRATITNVQTFEKMAGQRAWAASVVLTLGSDAATDDVAIKAAISVASGALPRKTVEAIAEKLKGQNDAPAFALAIKSALADKKASKGKPGARSQGGKKTGATDKADDKAPANTPASLADILAALDAALKDMSATKEPEKYVGAIKTAQGIINRHKVAAEKLAPVKAPAKVKVAA
jgi:hypothetical protein